MIARHEELASPSTSPPVVDAPPPLETGPSDPIAAWLDVLCSLLRLPAPEKRSVRDELENHLRERVRDLIVTGLSESQAAGKAVGELGDAALLAREFRAARRTPTRRTIMNLAVIGIAAGGLVTSLVALTGGLRPQSVPVSVFQPASQPPAAPNATVRFDKGQDDAAWPELFNFLAKPAGMPVFVHWPSLGAISADPPIEETSQVHLRLSGEMPLDRAVELINDDLGLDPENRIDYRVRDGRLLFASTSFFDRQETMLATYDLSDLVNQRITRGTDVDLAAGEVVEEVSQLIKTLVHSNQWTDNGGDLAALTHYGPKLFVKAPKRFHPEIQWLLAEVGSGEAQPAPKRAKEAGGGAEVRAHAIQHISSDEALKALKTLQSIRTIDFTPFAVDPRNNSIIGRASPAEHLMVAGALLDIDTPNRAQAQAVRAQLRAGAEDLRQRLTALADKRQEAEKQLAVSRQQNGNDHQTTKESEAVLGALRDQEAAVRADLESVEESARMSR